MMPTTPYKTAKTALLLACFCGVTACNKPAQAPSEQDPAPTQAEADSKAAQPADRQAEKSTTQPPAQTDVYDFEAHGNEPFWLVGVQQDKLVYKTAELPEGIALPAQRQADGKGVSYAGEKDGVAYHLSISPSECFDDMSGEAFDMTATFTYGNNNFTGCAEGV